MTRLALLRGINVGGRNRVPMADLRAALEDLGATEVQTYIASGNVLFDGEVTVGELESGLSERFGIEIKVVVLTEAELRAVVDAAPDGFGGPDDRCDVLFPRPPLEAQRVLDLLDPRDGIDAAWTDNGVVYFSRLAARASGSRLSQIVTFPEYQEVTIRSWSTTVKLLAVMDSRTEADRGQT